MSWRAGAGEPLRAKSTVGVSIDNW